ncbi:MAG TPA: TetR family transcriptional regulator [Acidimicrobiia bacterium]
MNARAGTAATDGAAADVEADARTRLREAALQRFGRQGIRGTSTREIIADAGLRNPSAITYYFGSKAQLVEHLVREVNLEQSAIIQQQVALAASVGTPTPEAWAATAVDAANGMLATERSCLLVRVWAERDESNPDAVETFLVSDHPLASRWRSCVATTFSTLPPGVAVARNVVVLRTLQWLTVRRARRSLGTERPPWHLEPAATRAFVLELVLNILTPPTSIADTDLVG